jgi:membrane protein implicated in regulation of membrane protease activity
MLIVALVMAVIGLAALVTAVVTSNEIIAWVCIGASVIGVVLLIVDALRERQKRDTTPVADDEATEEYVVEEHAAEESADGTESEPQEPEEQKGPETSQRD